MSTPQQDAPLDGHDRRSFLRRLALGGGAMLLAGGVPVRAGTPPDARPIGVQLYTLREQMKNDFEGTLEQVAAIGYDEVEFAGYFDHSPEDVRALLDRLGLSAPSAHVGLDQLRSDLDAQIEKARTIGHQFLTIPALPEGFQGTIAPEQWAEYAAELNEIGAALREADLTLAYHNHHFEFVPVDGDRTGFDVLLQETDPALVSFELDLMWTVVAGRDPVRLIEQYPGRFAMWHLKDLEGISQAQDVAQPDAGMEGLEPVFQRIRAVGEGDIDFARILERDEEAGLRHVFVEHDTPEAPTANVRTSYGNVERLLTQR